MNIPEYYVLVKVDYYTHLCIPISDNNNILNMLLNSKLITQKGYNGVFDIKPLCNFPEQKSEVFNIITQEQLNQLVLEKTIDPE
jgi:hypothetical protein